MRGAPLSATVFAVLGALLLVSAVALAALGSFAFIAIASVGMFFIAAALIARVVRSPGHGGPAVLALAAVGLIVFGTVATPLFYAGWACSRGHSRSPWSTLSIGVGAPDSTDAAGSRSLRERMHPVRIRDHVLGMGSKPTDPAEDRRRNHLFVTFALAAIVPVLPWAGIYYAYGEPVAAVFPLVYVPLTLASLAGFARTHDFERARGIQCLIILALPFGVHVALGGFQPSSGVVLSSVLAPFCALVFGGIGAGVRWLVAFAAVVGLAALVQPREANGLPAWVVTAFFAANIATISAVAFALLAGYARQLATERARSERLLLNMLPAPIATRLREREEVIADAYGEATMIFADVVNSTPLTAELTAREMVALLDEYVSVFDGLADRHGVEKIRTIGDNWMGVAGVPQPRPDHADAVARLALGMLEYVTERKRSGRRCLDFRIGINSGAVIGGVIGRRKFVFDIWGDPVNMAARMESHGEPGKIQITETTYELLKDGFVFEPRGTIAVKGKGPMRTWWLLGERDQPGRGAETKTAVAT